MKEQKVYMPYVNNTKAVLITLAINLVVVFLFNWPDGVTYAGVLWDSLYCGIITAAIDMWIVYASLKKIRAGGRMPAQVPVSRLMQRLPKNPFALGVIYAVIFGVLLIGVNAAVLRFFGIQYMAFVPWTVYKLVYTAILSAKITEYIIFRYVQPDWAIAEATSTEMHNNPNPIKNPLPKISVFKEIYASITGNIALNIIIGTALGGVVIGTGGEVVIYPTTVQGIPITGLVFGLIVGILVTNGVLKAMNAAILAPGADLSSVETMVSDKRYTWMPKGKPALMCFVCACVMAFSALALWAIMKLFGISVMNFYQFIVFITIYATIISRMLSYVLVRRCMQPDYIRYTLKKADVTTLFL